MYFQNDPSRTRTNGTTNSNIPFGIGAKEQEYDFNSQGVRQRQFQGNPIQPGATRQSYQDSDIFGTKVGSEIVQKSAMAQKDVSMRQSNTFARSNVIGNDEAAIKKTDGNIINGSNVVRHDKNWQSNVFGGPKQEQSKRVRLNKEDKGR